MSAAAFEEVGLCPELIACAERAGYALPTPIQSEAIPLALTGGDVLASAPRRGDRPSSSRAHCYIDTIP